MNGSLRILHAAGTGDIIGTYRCWARGEPDLSEVAMTYSEQFYDVCRELGAQAWVISSHPRREIVRDGQFIVEHRPIPFFSSRGLRFHIGKLWNSLRLIVSAIQFRANVVVVMNGVYWFSLAILALMGIRVVPSLHCALWPAGHRPMTFRWRLVHYLDGWFWRCCPTATIAVSPECERQVRELSDRVRGRFYQVRAQYRTEVFNHLPSPPNRRPFHILYAGRIARMKGVFDLLEVARQLESRFPGVYRWELCGNGPDLERLRVEVAAAGLESSFELRGKLKQADMMAAFSGCHVVVVPTNRLFAEGLNKVSVEGVLAGRVVVTSRLSNAIDLVGDAVVEVPPNDVAAYRDALITLAHDPAVYERKRAATELVRAQFYDRDRSWGAAVRRVLIGCATSMGTELGRTVEAGPRFLGQNRQTIGIAYGPPRAR